MRCVACIAMSKSASVHLEYTQVSAIHAESCTTVDLHVIWHALLCFKATLQQHTTLMHMHNNSS